MVLYKVVSMSLYDLGQSSWYFSVFYCKTTCVMCHCYSFHCFIWGRCDEERRIKYLFMFPWWPVGMGSSESIKTIVRYNVPLLLDITPLLYLISLHNLIFSFYTLSVKTQRVLLLPLYLSIYCWKLGNSLSFTCMKL